jgi:hypothetical protein
MLHHRVHDRQNRDRAKRGDESLDWMGDASHASAVAAQRASSRVAIGVDVGWESMRSGGSERRDARPFAIIPQTMRMSSTLVTARRCAVKVKKD